MNFYDWIYKTAIFPLFKGGLSIGALYSKKIQATKTLRHHSIREHHTFKQRPILIHAASGEYEYAKPLIRALKKEFPLDPILCTYFSPSYKEIISKDENIDLSVPLPWDEPQAINLFLKTYRPQSILISRTDIWPHFLKMAGKQSIPRILFSATGYNVPKIFHPLLRWRYSLVDKIFCVSLKDKKIFNNQGIYHVEVMGDTRIDQTLYRKAHPKTLEERHRPKECSLICGSTWPEDESYILKTSQDLMKKNQLKLIIVPHDISPIRIANLEKTLSDLSLTHMKYSSTTEDFSTAQKNILIVDQFGILPELYSWSHIAFVGGSFKRQVHSVMEPLTQGCFVLTGSRIKKNREALDFSQKHVGGSQLLAVQPLRTDQEITQALKSRMSLKNIAELKAEIQKEIQARVGASAKIGQALKPWLKTL